MQLLVFVHGTLQHGLAAEAHSVELSRANAAGEMADTEQGDLLTPMLTLTELSSRRSNCALQAWFF